MNHDILIIPILIDDAKLPEKDNIPDALIKLLDFRALQLRTISGLRIWKIFSSIWKKN